MIILSSLDTSLVPKSLKYLILISNSSLDGNMFIHIDYNNPIIIYNFNIFIKFNFYKLYFASTNIFDYEILNMNISFSLYFFSIIKILINGLNWIAKFPFFSLMIFG